jgi:hypothetical protein
MAFRKRTPRAMAIATAAGAMAFTALGAFAPAYSASCDKAVGHWTWFTGADVFMRPDHSVMSDGKTRGTWDCTYIAGAVLTLHWDASGYTYADTVTITPDADTLSGANQLGTKVWAKRSTASN